MKRTPAPILFTLAVAVSPLLKANETPAAPAPQPPAAAEKEAEPDTLAGLQQHFETINNAIREARTEVSDMAGQRDAARKEAAAVREAKRQLEQQLAGLKQQLGASNNEVLQWKDKATVLEKKLGAGEEAYEKLASFRGEMDAAMKEFAVLKNGLADIRGELQAPAERAALKKELAGLKGSHEELAKKLDAETKAHAENRRLLAASESIARELKQTIAKFKDDAKGRLEALAGKLAASEKDLAAARTEAGGLKEAATALEKERDSARSELAATQQTLAVLQQEAAQLRTSLQPLAAEIQSAKEQAELATAAIREANAARHQAESARTELEKELTTVKGELSNALANRDSLQQQVAAKATEIESLRKTVEELNARAANKAAGEENRQSAGL